MTAKELATRWIQNRQLKAPNWGKICGVYSNLLKRYNSDEIYSAMIKYTFYYPHSKKIEGFAGYCKRIIINERRKK